MSDARFSIIPGWVVSDPRLKGKDLQVLCMLGRHTSRKHGWCRRSQVKMALELSCARSTIFASIARLVEIGAVERREVPSESGRDSAHWYRVIYDREVSSNAIAAWDGEDEEEFGPIGDEEIASDPCRHTGTPAGIPAPPAGPESAPPAGSGPAPINDSCLTTDTLPRERALARENGDEDESPKALERRFRQWWSKWPTFEADDEIRTRNAWNALSPQQRRECEEKTPIWLERVTRAPAKGGLGRSMIKKSSTYLTQRMWERLPEHATQTTRGSSDSPENERWAVAYGPLHAAMLFRILLDGPDRPDIAPTSGLWLSSNLRAAWPRLAAFWQQTDMKGGLLGTETDIGLAPLMEFVPADAEVMSAWRMEMKARGLPEIRLRDGLRGLYFPAGGPDGIADFEMAMREVRGDEHAA